GAYTTTTQHGTAATADHAQQPLYEQRQRGRLRRTLVATAGQQGERNPGQRHGMDKWASQPRRVREPEREAWLMRHGQRWLNVNACHNVMGPCMMVIIMLGLQLHYSRMLTA